MEIQTISVNTRGGRGKGASRRLRSEGQIPAVIYGGGADAKSIAIDPRTLGEALRKKYGKNAILDLELEGETHRVMLQDHQKDPVSRQLLHADFYSIDGESPVEVDVPVRLVGRARGVAAGGVLRQIRRTVRVRCLPAHIPAEVEHDVTQLRFKQRAMIAQVVAPENTEVVYSFNYAIAQVNAPRGAEETDDEDEEESAEGAEDAEASEE